MTKHGHPFFDNPDREDNPYANRQRRTPAEIAAHVADWRGDLSAGSSVYFIRAGTDGPIKIGYSARDINERLSQLQTGNPEELCLIGLVSGTEDFEKRLHRRFRAHHIRGEWFRPDPEILAFIAGRAAPVALGATCVHDWRPVRGEVLMYRCRACERKGRKSLKTGVIHAYGREKRYSPNG